MQQVVSFVTDNIVNPISNFVSSLFNTGTSGNAGGNSSSANSGNSQPPPIGPNGEAFSTPY